MKKAIHKLNIFKLWKIWKDSSSFKSKEVEEYEKALKEGRVTNSRPVPKNIYDAKTSGEDVGRFKKIHVTFKYKFFIPLIYVAKWILDKYLLRQVPPGDYNTNLRLFDEAFEKTIEDWCKFYISPLYIKDRTEEAVKKQMDYMRDSYNVQCLRTLKEIYLTNCHGDSVYREFHNILMFNITKSMIEEYPDGNPQHMFFGNMRSFDVNYFSMFTRAKNGEFKGQLDAIHGEGKTEEKKNEIGKTKRNGRNKNSTRPKRNA